jgi:TonB family protein
MSAPAPTLQRLLGFLRARGPAVALGLAALVGAVLLARWVVANREAPPPRKVMQFTMVKVAPPPPPPPPKTLPPPPTPQKEPDQVEPQRVEVRALDIPPPDAPPPSSAPAAGPLALAGEATGPGDAFGLAGNPGGRGLLSGGGLGDGSGSGVGGGSASRYGWYYGRVQSTIQAVFRRLKVYPAASVRAEVRVWADATGRIERIQLIRPTGDAKVDEAIQQVVGAQVAEPPPPDTPMPVILRISFLRPG